MISCGALKQDATRFKKFLKIVFFVFSGRQSGIRICTKACAAMSVSYCYCYCWWVIVHHVRVFYHSIIACALNLPDSAQITAILLHLSSNPIERWHWNCSFQSQSIEKRPTMGKERGTLNCSTRECSELQDIEYKLKVHYIVYKIHSLVLRKKISYETIPFSKDWAPETKHDFPFMVSSILYNQAIS